jgi:hypothetical protein
MHITGRTARSRFTYANVTATLALVFAMSGGALAASHYLITSTKQISPKVLKALKGKAGANGANGVPGPAGTGAVGPQGAAGSQGPAGLQGAEGPAGKDGAPGKAGKEGKEGQLCKTECVLPSGATEVGVWNLVPLAKETSSFGVQTPISVPIPPAAVVDAAHVHIFEGSTLPEGCSGTVDEGGRITDLTATAGNLCVFVGAANGVTASQMAPFNLELGVLGAGRDGLMLINLESLGEGASASGQWAITAE